MMGVDMQCPNNTILNLVADKVAVNLNVFCALMKYQTGCHMKSSLAVIEKQGSRRMINMEVFK
jgi:hypothetical protein